VWCLLHAIELSDLIKGVDTWGETTVEAEDLVLNNSCEWKVIEEFGELFPYVGVTVLSQAFIIESIHLGDLPAFVVSSKDSKSILKADLESDEKSDSLDGVVAAIDVVTHEEVVGVGRLTTNLKQFSQVVELTVNVTTDRDWSTDLLDVRFVNKDFFCLFAKKFDLTLGERFAG